MTGTYLITGITGFIGSFVAEQLVNEGERVVGFDVADEMSTLTALGIADDVVVDQGDVTDAGDVEDAFATHDPDYVIHLASLLLDSSASNPSTAFDVNCVGTKTVFETALRHDVERVVYASSMSVYAGAPRYDTPVDEETLMDPPTFYGACKLFNEYFARTCDEDSTKLVGLRPSIVYGPYRQSGGSKFLVDMIEKPLAGEDISVQYGDQSIDWVYVRDVARAFSLAATADSLSQSVYNVCGDYRRIADAASLVNVEFVGNVSVSPDGDLPLLTHEVDGSAASADFGYRPQYSFREGVRDFAAEYGQD